MAFSTAGEDRGDLCLGCSLVAGIKNTTADFLVDGIVAVGVVLNEPHFAMVPLVNLACQGRVVSSASHGGLLSSARRCRVFLATVRPVLVYLCA